METTDDKTIAAPAETESLVADEQTTGATAGGPSDPGNDKKDKPWFKRLSLTTDRKSVV